MDIAAVSVITSGVVGVAGLGSGVWSARKAARTAIAAGVAQRRSDAYLELLRLVERRGEHLAARVNNIQQRDQEDRHYFSRPTPPVEVTDQAMAAAFLSAYGSEAVRSLYDKWWAAVADVEEGFHILEWNCDQNGDPDGDLDQEVLKELVQEQPPREVSARKALGVQVALELDRR
jgi:hypothetical protein